MLRCRRYANGFELQTSMQSKVCGIDRKWMLLFFATRILVIGFFLKYLSACQVSSKYLRKVVSTPIWANLRKVVSTPESGVTGMWIPV